MSCVFSYSYGVRAKTAIEKVKQAKNIFFSWVTVRMKEFRFKSELNCTETKSRRAFFCIFFVLFSFDVLFLIDIFIEILVDLLAVLRDNTERACA